MRWLWFIFFAGTAFAQRPGTVQFSDGRTLEGRLSLTPGAQLQIVDGTTLHTVEFERVREIRFVPDTEKMEQKWRFPVAGQTRKEKWGAPYPTRQVRATVVLADGGTLAGHLYTTVVYVEGAEKNEKVVLLAKQRGKEGETFQQLVYPTRLAFADAGPSDALVRVPAGETVLTRPALVRLEAGETPLGAPVFRATHTGDAITVGWPAAVDEKSAKLVNDAMPNVRDFFDSRKVLGVWREPGGGDIYSLMMLERKGGTTLGAEKSQPWRCEVWRWKVEDEEHRLLLAGRGYFFRGIVGRDENAPAVKLSEKLWNE